MMSKLKKFKEEFLVLPLHRYLYTFGFLLFYNITTLYFCIKMYSSYNAIVVTLYLIVSIYQCNYLFLQVLGLTPRCIRRKRELDKLDIRPRKLEYYDYTYFNYSKFIGITAVVIAILIIALRVVPK